MNEYDYLMEQTDHYSIQPHIDLLQRASKMHLMASNDVFLRITEKITNRFVNLMLCKEYMKGVTKPYFAMLTLQAHAKWDLGSGLDHTGDQSKLRNAPAMGFTAVVDKIFVTYFYAF